MLVQNFQAPKPIPSISIYTASRSHLNSFISLSSSPILTWSLISQLLSYVKQVSRLEYMFCNPIICASSTNPVARPVRICRVMKNDILRAVVFPPAFLSESLSVDSPFNLVHGAFLGNPTLSSVPLKPFSVAVKYTLHPRISAFFPIMNGFRLLGACPRLANCVS